MFLCTQPLPVKNNPVESEVTVEEVLFTRPETLELNTLYVVSGTVIGTVVPSPLVNESVEPLLDTPLI